MTGPVVVLFDIDETLVRTGLGVEPMTCAPNAFRSGDGLIYHLDPGESTTATWGLRASLRRSLQAGSEQSHRTAAGRRDAPDAPERPRAPSPPGTVAMSLLTAVS